MKPHYYYFKILSAAIILIILSSYQAFGQTTLKKIGKFNPGMCYGLSLNKHYAYTTTNKSLIILDILNPEKPNKVSELVIGSPIFGLSILNNYAFLAASDKGLIIVDISNPNVPSIISEYSSVGTVIRADVVDNYCYIICQETGIEIVDISKPTNPIKLGSFKIAARAISIQEDIAYVSDPVNGLTILNISNPGKIEKLTIVNNTVGAAGICVNNDFLFLGSYDNWVRLYNISEPQSPKLITCYTYPNEVSGLKATDNFLITNFQGITIKDISDVKNPVSIAEYHVRGIKGGVHGIVLRNNYIYFALKGITILKIETD